MTAFLDPWANPQSEGYHMIQSLLSFSTGGVTGEGWATAFRSSATCRKTRPTSSSPSSAKSSGLFGALLTVALYLGILYVAWQVVKQQARRLRPDARVRHRLDDRPAGDDQHRRRDGERADEGPVACRWSARAAAGWSSPVRRWDCSTASRSTHSRRVEIAEPLTRSNAVRPDHARDVRSRPCRRLLRRTRRWLSRLTIFLAGGGTGGHLYPGIAVAEALRDALPDCRPVFLCTQKEIDRVILEPTGFEFIPQPIVPPVRHRRRAAEVLEELAGDEGPGPQTDPRATSPRPCSGLGGYAAGVGGEDRRR